MGVAGTPRNGSYSLVLPPRLIALGLSHQLENPALHSP